MIGVKKIQVSIAIANLFKCNYCVALGIKYLPRLLLLDLNMLLLEEALNLSCLINVEAHAAGDDVSWLLGERLNEVSIVQITVLERQNPNKQDKRR